MTVVHPSQPASFEGWVVQGAMAIAHAASPSSTCGFPSASGLFTNAY